jgi:hypothetical protein
MTNAKVRLEGRKHKRFQVVGDAFVLLRPSYYAVGRIIDISMGGLTFDYMVAKEEPIHATALEIFLPDGSFHSGNIPCQAIWDMITYESPLTSTKKKRCGVQFGQMTDAEEAQLEYFIDNHTTAMLESQPHIQLSENRHKTGNRGLR